MLCNWLYIPRAPPDYIEQVTVYVLNDVPSSITNEMSVSKQKLENNESTEGVSVSEKKRLQSLKQMKESFRLKEQVIQNALRNLDNKPKKNKIIFDDNVDDVPAPKVRKRGKDLFDDEDREDEIEPNWDTDDFQKKKTTAKALAGKYSFGNDERFKLDERFLEDEEPENSEPVEGGDDTDLQKEKEWQLDLLGSVLGVPVLPKDKDAPVVKKSMIRYDPSEKTHQSYEITQEQEVHKAKKKKKDKTASVAIEEEDKPVNVSKDIYFSVSQNLTKSFKEEGGFSLLKTFGKEESSEKNQNENSILNNAGSNKPLKPKFHFDTKNPFKYDSSDEENDDVETGKGTLKNSESQVEERTLFSSSTDRFFFDANDTRFNEALKFFSKEALPDGEFKSLRRELKQIVRAKIRNNVQKSQPWGGGKKSIKNRPRQTS